MADCSGFIQPLNLECWTVNVLSGTGVIFALVALFFITMMASRFRMTGEIFGISVFLFAVLFGAYYNGLYFLIVLIGGMMVYPIIRRLITR